MASKTTRLVTVVALVAVVVVLVCVWPDNASRDGAVVGNPPRDMRRGAPSDSWDGTRVPPSLAPAASDTTSAIRSTPSAVEARRPSTQAPVRLEVHAPSDVRVGDVFQARLEIEANDAVRDLMVSIGYENSRLSLVGWSDGEFVRQPGVPSDFGIDEPSDGNIEVIFRARNGSWANGAGTLVVFEFEAIRPGTSGITLRNVTVVGATATARATDGVPDAGVANLQTALLRAASITVH